MPDRDEQFVSEPIRPVAGSFDRAGMARGEPGLARRFVWRGREHRVVDVLETWTTSTPEGGSGELYLRRHWWRVRTDAGLVMTLYCERQAQRRNAKARWFVYTIAGTPGVS